MPDSSVSLLNSTGQAVPMKTFESAGIHEAYNRIDSLVPGTGSTEIGKAEDAAHASGDTGILALGIRQDTPAVTGGTNGDYSGFGISPEGGQWAALLASVTGGALPFRSLDVDETEEEIKATAGQIYGYYYFNAANAILYLKFYNATAANVTVGTTTPQYTFPLPVGAAAHISFPVPLQFTTAICVAATTGLADNDTGAPGTNEVILNVFYK